MYTYNIVLTRFRNVYVALIGVMTAVSSKDMELSSAYTAQTLYLKLIYYGRHLTLP